MWLGRRYLSKEDSMKPLPIAIAVTAGFPWPFVQRHKPHRLRQLRLRSPQTSTTLPICIMGMPIRTAGMGITTDIAGTEVTTIIGIIHTGAITTLIVIALTIPATCPRQIMFW